MFESSHPDHISKKPVISDDLTGFFKSSNKSSNILLLLFLSLTLLLFACTDFNDEVPVYQVQSDMQPFVDNFFNEAEKRGIHLEKENLIVRTSDNEKGDALLPPDAAGYFIQIGNQRYITIWTGAFYYYKDSKKMPAAAERLIFHELGHAFGRQHCNNAGSIMCQCQPNEVYVGNDSIRTALLNELIDKRLIY